MTTHNPITYWRGIAQNYIPLSHTPDAPSFFRNDGAPLIMNPEFLNNLQSAKNLVLIVAPPNTIYQEENSGIRSRNSVNMYLLGRVSINDFDELETLRSNMYGMVHQLIARWKLDRKNGVLPINLLVDFTLTTIANLADNWHGYQIQYNYFEQCVPVPYTPTDWITP